MTNTTLHLEMFYYRVPSGRQTKCLSNCVKMNKLSRAPKSVHIKKKKTICNDGEYCFWLKLFALCVEWLVVHSRLLNPITIMEIRCVE